MVRVIKECGSIADGVAYMACNTIASLNLGALPVHVDGAKGGREPTAELCTTRWAASLRHLSTADKVAELAAAREAQPLLGMSLWLRPGLSLDVTPASGLAIVPGTEGEHGVPEPLPDADGRDLERGFTRSLAQSLRPDEATTDATRRASTSTTSAVQACAHATPPVAHARQPAQAGLAWAHADHTAQRRRALRQIGWTRAANRDRCGHIICRAPWYVRALGRRARTKARRLG